MPPDDQIHSPRYRCRVFVDFWNYTLSMRDVDEDFRTERFDRLEGRIDARFNAMDPRIDAVAEGQDGIEARMIGGGGP